MMEALPSLGGRCGVLNRLWLVHSQLPHKGTTFKLKIVQFMNGLRLHPASYPKHSHIEWTSIMFWAFLQGTCWQPCISGSSGRSKSRLTDYTMTGCHGQNTILPTIGPPVCEWVTTSIALQRQLSFVATIRQYSQCSLIEAVRLNPFTAALSELDDTCAHTTTLMLNFT